MLKPIIFFLLLSSILFSQIHKQIKLYTPIGNEMQLLQSFGIQPDHAEPTKDKALVFFLDEKEYNRFLLLGLKHTVLIEDWQRYYETERAISYDEIERANNARFYNEVRGFRYGAMGGMLTLQQIYDELDTLRINYPHLVSEKIVVGHSLLNRPIYAIKISDNPNGDEQEPEVLYTALHHAREPLSMMNLFYFAHYLCENQTSDPIADYLLKNREIYIIPVVNPDGYEHNRRINPSGGGMWRKNRLSAGVDTFGVDLNRNYGNYEYWNAPNFGSSEDKYDNTYRGASPFSEPETRAIRDFVNSHPIKNVLNYHTYSNLLIYPYGAKSVETPDSLIFRKFANDMTQYNFYSAGTDMQTVGYSTRGNSDDWMYDGDSSKPTRRIFAMTPEVGNFTDGFWPSFNRILPLAKENLYPNLYYAMAAGSFISLTGYDINKVQKPGDTLFVTLRLKNIGLENSSTSQVSLNSTDENLTLISPNELTVNLNSQEEKQLSLPFKFAISPSYSSIDVKSLIMTVKEAGNVISTDTIKIRIANEETNFEERCTQLSGLWTYTGTGTSWIETNETYTSSPASFTDSKLGEYINYTNNAITLKTPIKLEQTKRYSLRFNNKFALEQGYDYVRVRISTNGGSNWTSLRGKFSSIGDGSTIPAEPIYTGVNNSQWLAEEIDLKDYSGKDILLQFNLVSDEMITEDGFYVDDIQLVSFSPLPVELTSFTGVVNTEDIILNWKTSSEINNHGFEIQKLIESDWVTLGFIEGAGTDTKLNEYQFVDKNIAKGLQQYRLKQIDFSGDFSFSQVLSLEHSGVTTFSVTSNYPNPFNPSTVFEVAIPEKGNLKVSIVNSIGEIVKVVKDEVSEPGTYIINFDASQLSAGVYLAVINYGNSIKTLKMLLLK